MRSVPLAVPALALAVLLAGCVSAPIVPPSDAASPTGGMGLQLWWGRLDTRQYEFLTLYTDGSLDYAGGMKAFDRKVEWHGAAPPDVCRQVRAIVDQAGWMTGTDPNQDTEPSPIAELVVSNGRKDRSFTVRGPNESVIRIRELLSKVAEARFGRELQALPEAGQQRR
jgi:hypothetical protein